MVRVARQIIGSSEDPTFESRCWRFKPLARILIRILLVPLRNFGNFIYPTFPQSFRRYTKTVSPFCLLFKPGEIKDPTQGVNVKSTVDSMFYRTTFK